MDNICEQSGKLHNFSPRYTDIRGKNELAIIKKHNSDNTYDLLRELKGGVVYIGDICTQCGKFLPYKED